MLLLLPYHTALLSFSRLVRTMLTKCGYDVGCVTHEMMTIVAGDRFVSVCTMCELSVCVCVCVCTIIHAISRSLSTFVALIFWGSMVEKNKSMRQSKV